MPGVGGKPFQRMDGDGLVVFGPVAFGFARMRAHAPGDAGEGLRACSRARALPVSPAAISVCICWMPLPRVQACS